MLGNEELRGMSPRERRSLMLALAALEGPVHPNPAGERRRAIALVVIIVCCIALAVWTGVLLLTLPRYYRSGGWRGAWVGFDFALLLAFAVTGWAAWRRRQVLIICLIVLATLLCCDAWFDVVLDAHTGGFEVSLLSAVLIELPLAALAILGARRLLRMTIGMVGGYRLKAGCLPPLRKIPLLGLGPADRLRDLLQDRTDEQSARGAREPSDH